MTREEAIQVLESMKSEESYNALIDLCNMAIEALSSYDELYEKAKEVSDMANAILADFPSYKEALTEPSKVDYRTDESANIGTEVNDLISRADALMELNGACSNWQDDAKVAEIIHTLPSADRPHGEWIAHERNEIQKFCSLCGNEAPITDVMDDGTIFHELTEYCPHCGAEMTIICDVVDGCEDCPRYGDDCDGMEAEE